MTPILEPTSSLAIAQLQWAASNMIWSHWNKSLLVMLVCLPLYFPYHCHPLVHRMFDLSALCFIQHLLGISSLFMPKCYNGGTTTGATAPPMYTLTKRSCLTEHWKALLKVQLRHQLKVGCYPLVCTVCVDKWQIHHDALS